MKRFIRPHAGLFACAVFFAVAAGGLAVLVQFTKGRLLDNALKGDAGLTLRMSALLLFIIACEVTAYHLSDRFRGKYFTRAKADLREAFFRAQLRKTAPRMMGDKHGDILAAYTDQIDTVCSNYLFNLPLLADVVLKIVLVSAALFWLDVRVALLTLCLLTTPLYVPKIIEGRLQKAQSDTTLFVISHQITEQWEKAFNKWLTVG
jgi:ATP-binding cassette subfamily B protein